MQHHFFNIVSINNFFNVTHDTFSIFQSNLLLPAYVGAAKKCDRTVYESFEFKNRLGYRLANIFSSNLFPRFPAKTLSGTQIISSSVLLINNTRPSYLIKNLCYIRYISFGNFELTCLIELRCLS